MRAAVHHLRTSRQPPVLMNASAASRASGQLGSAERGDDLRLLSQFVQASGPSSSALSRASSLPLPAARTSSSQVKDASSAVERTSSAQQSAPALKQEEEPSIAANDADTGNLSASALRLQERGWSGLSHALETIDFQRHVENAGGSGTGLSSAPSSTAIENANRSSSGDAAPSEEPRQAHSPPSAADPAQRQLAAEQVADMIKVRQASSDSRLIDALLKGGTGSGIKVPKPLA